MLNFVMLSLILLTVENGTSKVVVDNNMIEWYKIEFEKPSIEARKAIWEVLMPDVAGETAQELASRFDFSGGQIENIARKVTVYQVLHGTMPSPEAIAVFCNEEYLNRGSMRKIGFSA